MITTSVRNIVFFLGSFALLNLLFVSGCSEVKEDTSNVSALEQQYQDLLDQSGSGGQLDEVWSAMKALAAAYEERSQQDGKEDDQVEDLYRAAELYGGAFEYEKSLAIFDQIVSRFPEHKRAADALFQKGFIYNNRIGDTASARAAYTTFIRKYPEDPLAHDAQIEIDRLGIPTEQWLQKFTGEDSTAEKNPN